MSCKKAVLVSCFNYYEIRLKFVESYLRQNGFETTYITSNFDHIAKRSFKIRREFTVQVHAKPYRKNLSISRMLSHYLWSRNVIKKIKRISPELLFVMLPPNSLARLLVRYSRRSGTKLVFDIYDLWPETYPLSKSRIISIPFYFWKRMRDKYLSSADFVSFECLLFHSKLFHVLGNTPSCVVYPALDVLPNSTQPIWDENVVHLAYLGSINNIIDIPAISSLISEVMMYKPVHLHIIGRGESKAQLLSAAKYAGAIVTDYDVVFDLQEKMKILSMCRFGINVMKQTVCVGLTMKSIDYFRSGLPIVNSIPADTASLIERYVIGFNIGDEPNIGQKIAEITLNDYLLMKTRVLNMFNELFSPIAFNRTLQKIFSVIQS